MIFPGLADRVLLLIDLRWGLRIILKRMLFRLHPLLAIFNKLVAIVFRNVLRIILEALGWVVKPPALYGLVSVVGLYFDPDQASTLVLEFSAFLVYLRMINIFSFSVLIMDLFVLTHQIIFELLDRFF
tara:strand:- start:202 stop:585 length:384 start_codon:yes stop_codon:yes gene_type:complete